MEIEKKYLIKRMPENLDQYVCKNIEQGYLCQEPVVRIRKSDEDYILTYKARTASLENAGARVRNEIEMPLTKESYEHLKAKTDFYCIEKKRYLIPLENDRTAELDIFNGRLKGLAIVEVEFDFEEQAAAFIPPEWFGKDVSMDGRYSNSYLSNIKDSDVLMEVLQSGN